MNKPHTIKRGDTWPPLTTMLEDEDGPVPLTGATVRLVMKQVVPAGVTPKVVDAEVPLSGIDVPNSTVSYPWATGDTDVAGVYRAEWKVTFGHGGEETFPSEGWDDVIVRDDLP